MSQKSPPGGSGSPGHALDLLVADEVASVLGISKRKVGIRLRDGVLARHARGGPNGRENKFYRGSAVARYRAAEDLRVSPGFTYGQIGHKFSEICGDADESLTAKLSANEAVDAVRQWLVKAARASRKKP